MKIVMLGIDLGKNLCSLAGLDETGAVVLQQCHYERDHGHGEQQTGEGHGAFDVEAVLVDPRAH